MAPAATRSGAGSPSPDGGGSGADVEERWLDLPGGRFRALTLGPADGPPVLGLHGFPDVPRSLVPVGERLAAHGYRVVLPWLRGYSPSPLDGPFDLLTLSEEACELARVVGQGRPVHLIGHDWGAVLAWGALGLAPRLFGPSVVMSVPHLLALRGALLGHPGQVRRSWYMLFFQLRGLADRAARRGDHALIERLWRDWSPGLVPPPAHLRELKRCLEESGSAPLEYYRSLRLRQPALERALRGIQVPVLYLHGQDDGCMGAALTGGQERFMAAPFRCEVLPGCGHFLQLEAPDRVAVAALAWIDGA